MCIVKLHDNFSNNRINISYSCWSESLNEVYDMNVTCTTFNNPLSWMPLGPCNGWFCKLVAHLYTNKDEYYKSLEKYDCVLLESMA